MKAGIAFLLSALLSDATVAAIALPASDVAVRQPLDHTQRDSEPAQDLWKRRGGGGGGGRGGGGSSGGGSSGGSSSGGSGSGGSSSGGSSSGGSGSGGSSSGGSSSGGSSSGGSSSGGSSSGGSTGGRGSGSSNTGGATKTGSGPPRSYGGGSYYSGGARQPYRSGGISPAGIVPFFFVGSALAFWPGLWYHPAYYYPYHNPYGFYNHSSNKNESKPVACACDETVECGCDDSGNSTFMNELVGDGSYQNLNQSVVTVADVNGTSTILINGTLPNGTTADGGTDDAFGSAGVRTLLQGAGWWPVVATVCALVFMS